MAKIMFKNTLGNATNKCTIRIDRYLLGVAINNEITQINRQQLTIQNMVENNSNERKLIINKVPNNRRRGSNKNWNTLSK